MVSLQTEVARFKDWASTQLKDSREWEADYDGWGALREAADAVLAKARVDGAEIDLLLYALARDNEGEVIKEMLEEYSVNAMRLARAAGTCPDPDARWQVADFLGTRDDDEARALLRRMVSDPDEYVRRRALLASARTDPQFAGRTASVWLTAEHEDARVAALTILHDLKSPELAVAIDRLKDDPSSCVRDKIAEFGGPASG